MARQAGRLRLAQCIDLVRKEDPAHYLCCTHLKPEHRSSAFTFHALNLELDQVAKKTSKAQFASLKFKWWTDAINKVCSESDAIPSHPVVLSLPELVNQSRTSKYFLSKLVQGKLDKAENPLKVVKTLETLEEHAESVYSSLFYLILESSQVEDSDCLHAASHMGKGVGLTLLLKSIPEDALVDKVYLPTDLCLQSKMSYGEVTKGINSDNLSEVVYQVAARAKNHLDEARRRYENMPNNHKPFLLPCIPALQYLERLERVGFAPFTPELHDNALTALQLQVKVGWSNFIGKM